MENDMTNANEEPQAAATEQVGYGKPPKATQWKPGQSGNPRGGRVRAPSLRELFLRVASEPVREGTGGRTRLEEVMSRAFSMGSSFGHRLDTQLVLELAREFLPDDEGGVELDDGEYVPPKMTEERKRDLTRLLGYDPDKPGTPMPKRT